jgi:nicotinamidase-related amidase
VDHRASALPFSTTVVLVGFQNDVCSPKVARAGLVTHTGNAATAARANAFATAAASFGAHIIYTRQVLDSDK